MALSYSLPALRLPIASSLHQSLITSPQSLELSVFFWREGSKRKLVVIEKTQIGGIPPKPPIGGRSASPKPPAQGLIGCDEFS
jgi:hypothetical protein